MSVSFSISSADRSLCRDVATLRMSESKKLQLNAHVLGERLASNHSGHYVGNIGELAVARLLGVHGWKHTINNFKGGDGDVGANVQVRTRTLSKYELIVRPGDAFVTKRRRKNGSFYWTTPYPMDTVFVKCHISTVKPDECRLCEVSGWIYQHEAFNNDWFVNHGGHPYAWFVPNDRLRPTETLKDVYMPKRKKDDDVKKVKYPHADEPYDEENTKGAVGIAIEGLEIDKWEAKPCTFGVQMDFFFTDGYRCGFVLSPRQLNGTKEEVASTIRAMINVFTGIAPSCNNCF